MDMLNLVVKSNLCGKVDTRKIITKIKSRKNAVKLKSLGPSETFNLRAFLGFHAKTCLIVAYKVHDEQPSDFDVELWAVNNAELVKWQSYRMSRDGQEFRTSVLYWPDRDKCLILNYSEESFDDRMEMEHITPLVYKQLHYLPIVTPQTTSSPCDFCNSPLPASCLGLDGRFYSCPIHDLVLEQHFKNLPNDLTTHLFENLTRWNRNPGQMVEVHGGGDIYSMIVKEATIGQIIHETNQSRAAFYYFGETAEESTEQVHTLAYDRKVGSLKFPDRRQKSYTLIALRDKFMNSVDLHHLPCVCMIFSLTSMEFLDSANAEDGNRMNLIMDFLAQTDFWRDSIHVSQYYNDVIHVEDDGCIFGVSLLITYDAADIKSNAWMNEKVNSIDVFFRWNPSTREFNVLDAMTPRCAFARLGLSKEKDSGLEIEHLLNCPINVAKSCECLYPKALYRYIKGSRLNSVHHIDNRPVTQQRQSLKRLNCFRGCCKLVL